MIFHENRLLADDSHEISYLFFQTMLQNLSSAAVVIGALRVRECHLLQVLSLSFNQLKTIFMGHQILLLSMNHEILFQHMNSV